MDADPFTAGAASAASASAHIAIAKAAGGAAAFADVVAVLTANAGCAQTAEQAIDALSSIALRSVEVRDSAEGGRALRPIVKCLVAHAAHPGVVIAASKTLVVLTANTGYEHKAAIVREGALGPLVAALTCHSARADVIVAVCGVLYRMASSMHDLIDASEVLDGLVKALENHFALPAVVKAILQLLSKLSINSELLASSGLLPHLVNAFQVHAHCEAVIHAACTCLRGILRARGDIEASGVIALKVLALSELGVVQPLLANLETHAANKDIVRDACASLQCIYCALTDPYESRGAIMARITSIVRAATLHIAHLSTTVDVCRLLSVVCDESLDALYVNSGAILFTFRAVLRHLDSRLIVRAFLGIMSCCCSAESKAVIFNEHGVHHLIATLTPSASLYSVGHVMIVLAVLYKANPVYKPDLLVAIPQFIVSVETHSHHYFVTIEFCNLVRSIITDFDDFDAAFDEAGTLDCIIVALMSNAAVHDAVRAILPLMEILVDSFTFKDGSSESIITACKAAFTYHSDDAEVSAYVCRVLSDLVKWSSVDRKNVAGAGALGIAMTVLASHPNNMTAVERACTLIWYAEEGTVNSAAIISSVYTITGALTRHGNDAKLVEPVSRALRVLAYLDSEIPEELIDNAKAALCNAAKSHACDTSAGKAVRACIAALSRGSRVPEASACSALGCVKPATFLCFRCLTAGYCSDRCACDHIELHLPDCYTLDGLFEERVGDSACIGTPQTSLGELASSAAAAPVAVSPPSDFGSAAPQEDDIPVEVCAADNCGDPAFFQCGRCCSVRYCSRVCQRAHYRVHRTGCRLALAAASVHDVPPTYEPPPVCLREP